MFSEVNYNSRAEQYRVQRQFVSGHEAFVCCAGAVDGGAAKLMVTDLGERIHVLFIQNSFELAESFLRPFLHEKSWNRQGRDFLRLFGLQIPHRFTDMATLATFAYLTMRKRLEFEAYFVWLEAQSR